jgi:hypothetical protein
MSQVNSFNGIENESKKKVQHVTDIVGEFGQWQLWLAIYVFLIDIVSAFNNMGYTFHAFKVDFWCEDVPQDYHVSY